MVAVTGVKGIVSSFESNTLSLLISQNSLPETEEASTSKSILISEAVCLIACSSETIMLSFCNNMLLDTSLTLSISVSKFPIETAKVKFPAGAITLYSPFSLVVALPCGTLYSSETVTFALAIGDPSGVATVPYNVAPS